jgi:hypothetical protein
MVLEHQDITPHNRIKGQRETHLSRIALGELQVAEILTLDPRRVDGGRGAIDTDHLAALAYHLGEQHARVTGAAADVQHAHARFDAGLLEQAARDRIDKSSLGLQAIELFLGMPERISSARFACAVGMTHGFPFVAAPLRHAKDERRTLRAQPLLDKNRIIQGDAPRLHCRTVDAKAALAFLRDRAQDRWIALCRYGIKRDHDAPAVALVGPHAQGADAKHAADPFILAERAAVSGLHKNVGSKALHLQPDADHLANAGEGLRGDERKRKSVEDSAVHLDDAHSPRAQFTAERGVGDIDYIARGRSHECRGLFRPIRLDERRQIATHVGAFAKREPRETASRSVVADERPATISGEAMPGRIDFS